MAKFVEKTISSEVIYSGKVVHLQVDQVELPNGQPSTREIIKHSGAVAVIAITPANKLVLVRQFRKALEKTILEIPAGKLEPGEKPIDCAQRELEEETGYIAHSLTHLVSFYTSPGFADEYLHLYQTSELSKGAVNPDPDEFVELIELSLDECQERIRTGEICDAKTIAAIYHWQVLDR